MASIVFQKDKRSGITYAYESVSKRTLIGRVDDRTGEIVPTDGRNRKKKAEEGPAPQVVKSFYGATYLFDAIGRKLGITEDLEQCFPETFKQILSIAYYLILEDKNPLYQFEKWGIQHRHPYGKDISSQRSSELFASITEEAKAEFFRLRSTRQMDKEFWIYDITVVPNHPENLSQVQWGNNKEDDGLPELSLALVFEETSNLPFCYRQLTGNISASKTQKVFLDGLDDLRFSKVKLVVDRCFYSEKNINALLRDGVKFLISSKMFPAFIRKNLDPIYEQFRSYNHFSEKYELYCHTVQTEWAYTQYRPYKGDTLSVPERIYVHYYYNINKAAEDEKAFDRRLLGLCRELESGKRVPEHKKLYHKFFEIKTTPEAATKATVKEEEVSTAKRYFGFFALVSNEAMDAITALELYRNKDLIEEALGSLKARLNMRRTLGSSKKSPKGKLFVEFIGLIYLSYIKKQMQDTGLFKDYTLATLLETLDAIECFESPDQMLRAGEPLEKQKRLYAALGVDPPT